MPTPPPPPQKNNNYNNIPELDDEFDMEMEIDF